MDFSGQLILVSGASSGIGKRSCELLLERKCQLIGVDVQPGTISHDCYTHYELDIRDETSVEQRVNDIVVNYHRIDGLVNAAGIFAHNKPFYELDTTSWNKVISINLSGIFILSKYVARCMIRQNRGKIVNVSCIRSAIFRPNMSEYAASKGGVVSLTSAMALDLAQHNVQVNSVAPGFTYTESGHDK